jgi:hypothetical protein
MSPLQEKIVSETSVHATMNGNAHKKLYVGKLKIGPVLQEYNFESTDLRTATEEFDQFVRDVNAAELAKVNKVGIVRPFGCDLKAELKKIRDKNASNDMVAGTPI